MSENEKLALVTGASRGFGYAIAQALGARGYRVIAVARTVGGLEELDDAIKSAGGPDPLLVPLDLKDGEGIDRLGAALYERYGKLDLLIHAAAIGVPLMPLSHIGAKDVEQAFATNTQAVWRLVRSLDPLLRAAPAPRLIHIDDEKSGEQYWGVYGASKAAAAAMIRSYSAEAPTVRVDIHQPPEMPTALHARTHPGADPAALTHPRDAAAAMIATFGL
ncbi:MAG: SDR family NAD(P)-dependent oxidoreductase [Neomegalonema sp.]|nr:SDR family NAD(P)-dependent oxidoreductase [Neomegalonema sp.]